MVHLEDKIEKVDEEMADDAEKKKRRKKKMDGNHKIDIEEAKKGQNIILRLMGSLSYLFVKPDCGPIVDSWGPIADTRASSDNSEEHK